tara:strand:- start:672 stop:1784 length:1113 start_codon:yes stop_codon:yes gene_type:complete
MIIRIGRQKTRIEIRSQNGRDLTWGASHTIHPVFGNIKQGDPIHVACMSFFKYRLKQMGNTENIISIRGLDMLISKDDRYYLNGINYPQSTIVNALARILVKSTTEESTVKLLSSLYTHLSLPENISYALENKIPYTFFNRDDDGILKQEVRMNLMQIGKKDFAIEISDGLWGNIVQSDLNTFVNSGRFNHKRGKWHSLSPKVLFTKLIGRSPSDSELKLMIAFLMQNRKRDIVEKRAKELLEDIAQKHKDKIVFIEEENHYIMFIKGQEYDWMLVSRGKTTSDSSRQGVNTYIWELGRDDVPCWKGPICIDNMSSGSSMGDQMVGRALPLLNDSITMKRVETISSYITDSEIERLSFEEMIEQQKNMGR